MNESFRSIRSKLITSGSAILIGTFLVVLSVVVYLSIQTADLQLKSTEENIRTSLKAKGNTLVSNNSQALKGMVADNAFSAVQALVSSTVRDDVDIEYGIFMDVDMAPWVIANTENPSGQIEGRIDLEDEVSLWAAEIDALEVKETKVNGIDIFEFAAPVTEDDEILGFIRYGFSTRRMVDSLNNAREKSEESLYQTILVIGGLGLLAAIFGFTFNKQTATKITNPLQSLTTAAATIAEGDYSKSIEPETNDEIGQLADNFNTMRVTIQKKMQDLSELNQVGEDLAGITDKTKALETALKTMQTHTNVRDGSVYLYNDEGSIEVEAFYPPKISRREPHAFKEGEGILGIAAEEKKTIFVQDTSKSDSYEKLRDEVPKSLLCIPLIDNDVVIGVMNFSGEVGKVIFEESDYEYASSVARLLVITIKNIHMREEIEEYNRSLEEKIKERTAALQEKTNDIMSMMGNMHQGLFTIVQGGDIHPEYAAYLEEIFETTNIAGRNFMDLMFTNSDLGSDILNQVETASSCLIGEDELMYDFNSHLLITEFTKTMPSGEDKIIELDWDPIVFDGIIQKLMVTVRDVTALKALQKEAEAQKRELEVIGEILSLEESKFAQFIHSAERFIKENRDLIESNTTKDLDVIATLFRNMHTIKGNARTYGFKNITDVVHEAEETYDRMRKDESTQWDQSLLGEELNAVDEKISRYKDFAINKLGRKLDSGSESSTGLTQEMVDRIITSFRDIELSGVPDNVRVKLQHAIANVVALNTETLDSALSEILKAIPEMATELGKEKPVLDIQSGNVRINKNATSMLNNIFSHLIRNSIDHGIESKEERLSKGKSGEGHISIRSWNDDNHLKIAIKDDGRGLGIGRLKEKAIESGKFESNENIPLENIVGLMFESGMSTAEKVTEISGRGVGMDAVKRFIEENGGNININLLEKDIEKSFLPIETILTLPSSMYTLVDEC